MDRFMFDPFLQEFRIRLVSFQILPILFTFRRNDKLINSIDGVKLCNVLWWWVDENSCGTYDSPTNVSLKEENSYYVLPNFKCCIHDEVSVYWLQDGEREASDRKWWWNGDNSLISSELKGVIIEGHVVEQCSMPKEESLYVFAEKFRMS